MTYSTQVPAKTVNSLPSDMIWHSTQVHVQTCHMWWHSTRIVKFIYKQPTHYQLMWWHCTQAHFPNNRLPTKQREENQFKVLWVIKSDRYNTYMISWPNRKGWIIFEFFNGIWISYGDDGIPDEIKSKGFILRRFVHCKYTENFYYVNLAIKYYFNLNDIKTSNHNLYLWEDFSTWCHYEDGVILQKQQTRLQGY